MPVPGTIRYITSNSIDKKKWDTCIDTASNGLVYAYSFYLDCLSKHWDALVLNDYEAVMPLTWNKKYGISYLYQPPFVAMSGIFGKNLDSETVKMFIHSIPAKFRLIEISLNQGNPVTGIQSLTLNNYVLSLNESYSYIYDNYRENIKRNIKKSKQVGCYCKTGIPVEDVIKLNKEQLQHMIKVTDQDYDNFKKLYRLLSSKQQAITYGIFNASDQLLASCVYFFSHNRAYYILVGNHPDGKTLGAGHYLVDRFIADNSEKKLLLDFEGSDIRNLAFFYDSFGATVETYPALRFRRLPGWLQWLRK
jgi:hypothetical protein